jgi:hypothetical protein
VTLEKSGPTNLVNVALKRSGGDPEDIVFLEMALTGRKGKAGTTFYRSMFSSSPAGVVDAAAKATVPSGARKVCVTGTTINAATITSADKKTRQKQIRKLRKQLGKRTCALGTLDLSKTSFTLVNVS